jgi:3-phenylpropionate/trans-cinnamate dioxygenase ferredoxin subunit
MGKLVEVCKTDEIPEGVMKGFKVEGKEILVANYQGKYYAIGEKCTHMGGDLSKGKLEGRIVTCPRHHSQFDVTTGNLLKGPAKKNEPSYEVKVEGQIIKVNI